MDSALDYYDHPRYTYSSFPNDSINDENVSEEISSRNTTDYGRHESIHYIDTGIPMLVICILGAVGNGIVIWLLGFHIKRNPFSTYILNLAIADFGVLVSSAFFVVDYWVILIYDTTLIFLVFLFLFLSTYSSSQFLLTAISIDSTITYTLMFLNLTETMRTEEYYQYILNAVLCVPVMTVATGALFIKVCFKPWQHRRGKLLSIVLLTLLFFLLFAFPFNVAFLLHIFNDLPSDVTDVAMLLACLNSSVNPAIYILVGRQWKSRRRETMKMILQKVFKEEESCTEESSAETQL
ncbi:UNVERIFIED_CONTAM: hypothetical protein K2H54_013386 [Gekko kuhli]